MLFFLGFINLALYQAGMFESALAGASADEVALIDFHQRIYGIVISSETFYRTMEAIFDYV